MRILYGVVGEGMGHAIRSKAVIDHLVRDEGHEVSIVVSGRAYDVLEKYFSDCKVHKIWGYSMEYDENQFKVWRSVLENVKEAFDYGWPDNIKRYFELTEEFEPDCVISDFESWSWLYGYAHRLPILCIDNIQMIRRCRHPEALIEPHKRDFSLAKAFVRNKTPHPTHYYVTTFFYPELRKKRTTLVPSVLRQEIIDVEPSVGEHVLVYQTSTSSSNLPEVLASADMPFMVYGYRRDIDAPVTEGNVTYKPFSEQGFVEDLASCKAVITNGGFTLMSEAVYLRKPVLSVPIKSQFEQVMNGFYLEKLGYGYTMDLLDVPTLGYFLEHLDEYRAALQSYEQDGNTRLFELLDAHLDRLGAGLK